MVVEVASLDGVGCPSRVELADALSPRMPDTRVDDAIRVCGFEYHRQPLGGNVAIRIEGWIGGLSSSQVVQIGTDRKNDLPELRGPTGLFGSAGHEPGMVMDGFGESGFEGIRSEEHTSEIQSLMRISYAVFCL